MNIDDISQMSLEIVRQNVRNYDQLSDGEILQYFDSKFDITKIPSLTDEDKAVALINEVISNNKRIAIIVDYDSDGLNSGAVAHKALEGKSSNYVVINNKRCNGNGFNKVLNARIMKMHDETPIDLIITGDHGELTLN